MIPLEQARARALAAVAPLSPRELPLEAARGHFLAATLRSTRAVPGTDNSAMDGFAVRAADTAGARRERPVRLRVEQTVAAGALPSRSLRPGEAARIFTGASMPSGADAVVRQEATRFAAKEVELFVSAAPGENVRRRGEEIAEGQMLLAAGRRLGAWELGVAATVGVARLSVRPRPRVALITCGDELIAPGAPAEPHQIYDSNAVLLRALAEEAGAELVEVVRSADDAARLGRELERLLPRCDLLLTCGGASVGERDLVKPALGALGLQLAFDGVALKPGKPTALAQRGGPPVLVLPGNPGAAAVAFDQLARPMLLRLQGVAEHRPRATARLGSARRKQPALTYLLAARLERSAGEPVAHIRPQGAGQIFQNLDADGWAVLPAGHVEFKAGDEIEVELFSGAAFEALP